VVGGDAEPADAWTRGEQIFTAISPMKMELSEIEVVWVREKDRRLIGRRKGNTRTGGFEA